MKFKTALIALILAAAPSLSFAACFGDHAQQAMSCADGKIYDAETESCVDKVNS